MNEKMIMMLLETLTSKHEASQKEIEDLRAELKGLKTQVESFINCQTNKSVEVADHTDLLTLAQVRKLLNCSRNSVLKYAKDGVLVVKRIHSRTIRYSKQQVLQLIESL